MVTVRVKVRVTVTVRVRVAVTVTVLGWLVDSEGCDSQLTQSG